MRTAGLSNYYSTPKNIQYFPVFWGSGGRDWVMGISDFRLFACMRGKSVGVRGAE